MVEEASLLQKIREKEIEMSVQIDSARRESDALIEKTKRDAAALIAGYEQLAQQAVSELSRTEREDIRKELEKLKTRLEEEERSLLERGEKNIPQARDLIVRGVILE
jgi:vacuolar-type H+-ATPase subunit H